MSNGSVLGKLEIASTGSGQPVTITLDGDIPSIVFQRPDGSIAMELHDDRLVFRSQVGNPAGINASGGAWVGGAGKDGWLRVFDDGGKKVLEVLASDSSVKLQDQGKVRAWLDGAKGDLWLGGNGAAGALTLLPKQATEQQAKQSAIQLSGDGRSIRVGLFSEFADQEEIRLDGKGHRIRISGPDPTDETGLASYVDRVVLDATEAGLLQLRDAQGTTMIELRAATGAGRFGGRGVDGDVLVFSKEALDQSPGEASVWIRGNTGDILLQNADCAEEFDVRDGDELDPGTVVVLDEQGRLAASRRPYDRKVAGVVSGAGDLRPGLILGRRSDRIDRVPVTLVGRVCCKVDAADAPISVGDLLTSSGVEGHAMRVDDPSVAVGAIVGKALARVEHGRGLIPMLLALG